MYILSFPLPVILPYALSCNVLELLLCFLFLSLGDLRCHQDFLNMGSLYHRPFYHHQAAWGTTPARVLCALLLSTAANQMASSYSHIKSPKLTERRRVSPRSEHLQWRRMAVFTRYLLGITSHWRKHSFCIMFSKVMGKCTDILHCFLDD